jgi:hypothetical protein
MGELLYLLAVVACLALLPVAFVGVASLIEWWGDRHG